MKKEWTWRLEKPAENLPLSLFIDPGAGERVKRNPFRSVRMVTASDGTVFYVKHDVPCSWTRIMKELIRPKNRSEFETAHLLQKAGLPCVEFAALGERFPESVLVSRALAGYISSLEFRYKATPESLRVFFHALAGMVRVMLQNHIRHPDFHAGNLMVSPDLPEKLCLLDLFGIRRSLIRPDRADSRIFCDFADLLEPGEGESFFREAGVDPELWPELQEKTKNRILREWPRRAGQILCGRSKFARMAVIERNVYHIRNTPWFTPVPFSRENCLAKTMDPDRAADLWLESFRADLLHEDGPQKPVAFRPGSKESVLYYAEK